MSISGHFIQRPIATSLLMAAILAVGATAYPFLPIAPIPQVDRPTIQVSANLLGASPETMAGSIAQPLERQFAQIPSVTQVTSTGGLGQVQVMTSMAALPGPALTGDLLLSQVLTLIAAIVPQASPAE